MKGNTIKILLVGSRHTGKGQIGREWGQTDADLPTLQPVILYDRNVVHEDKQYRVVAWVLSYDPEFADLRTCFFAGADGIVFTYDITEDPTTSLLQLDKYEREMRPFLRRLPPAVLVGVRLDGSKDISAPARARGEDWAKHRGIPLLVEANFLDKQQFASAVDEAFSVLINDILTLNKQNRAIAGMFKTFKLF
jgi:GTPase SAR1 family protein